MALANLLIKIGADISELKTGAEQSTRVVQQAAGKIDAIGSSIRSTLLTTFSVGAVVSFGHELLRMGDDIVRTADRTGLLTEEVQKLSYIAGQSGNSIEDITGAIGQMQNRLASGDKSALGSLKALNVSFDDLRRMNPYDQFQAIADVVGKIPNPATRAQVAMDLFGKSGLAILPTLTANVKALGDAAPVMSDSTVRALDAAGDTWDHFALALKVGVAESYNFVGKFFDGIIELVYRMIAGLYDGITKIVQLASTIPGATKVFGDFSGKIASLTETSRWYTDAANDMHAEINTVATSVRKAVPAFDAAGAAVTGLSDAQKKAIASAKAHAEALQKGRDALFGNGLIAAAKDLMEQLGPLTNLTKVSADKVKELNGAFGIALDTYKQQGRVAPEELRKAYQATIHLTQDTLPAINTFKEALAHSADGLLQMLPIVREWPTHFAGLNAQIERLPSLFTKGELAAKSFDDHGLDDLARSFAQLATISGDAFGGIVQDIANVVASYDLATKAAKAYGDATTKAEKGAALLSGAAAIGQGTGSGSTGSRVLGGAAAGAAMGTAILPGWGTAIGAAAGALIGLYRGLKGLTDYQKRMQAAVAETYNLQTSLVAAHGSMERLVLDADLVGINIKEAFTWKDPQAFKNIVAELDAKTQLLNASMQEYGFTWEDLGEKARGAKLGQLFDDLFAKTQILKGAGIDYHEILLRQSHDYSDLVQAAIRTGTEIPAAMKPVLQDLIDMGTLVDENGQSFTDLGQLKFAETMTEGFHQVTDAIHELISALVDGVGPALDDIGRRVVRPHISPVFDDNGASATAGYAGGTHGQFVDFGAGTHVVLHGHERISTPGEGSGGGGDVHVFIGNAQLDSHLVRVARKDAAQGGLKPRARSGRSY